MPGVTKEMALAQPSPPASAPAPAVAAAADTSASKSKPKKICCACPETKQARDECVVMNGESACTQLVEAHKACLRRAGFDVK